ncbi:hypothetical protein BH20ACT2_BH20ACT2_24930 [soil metagenome]
MKGYTTIHAGSARQALTRLRFICQLSETDLPMSALNSLVSEAIDVVVHLSRGPHGPHVTEVLAVEDLAGGAESTQFTVTEVFRKDQHDRPLTWTGEIPVRMDRPLREIGVDLRHLLEADLPAPPAPARASAARTKRAQT